MHYGSKLLSTTNMGCLTLTQWHTKLILSIIIHLLTIVYMSEWESLVGKHSWYKPVFGTASRVRNPYYVLMPNTVYPSHLVLQCGGNSSSPSEWANIPISRLWAFSRNVAVKWAPLWAAVKWAAVKWAAVKPAAVKPAAVKPAAVKWATHVPTHQ